MKGDFSRLTGKYAIKKNYNGVLKQQGRVSLDSDVNEQLIIDKHQRQTRTKDLVGQSGVPLYDDGFKIYHNGLTGNDSDLLYSAGRIYVDGILCESHPASRIPFKILRGQINQIKIFTKGTVEDRLATYKYVLISKDTLPGGKVFRIDNINKDKLTLDKPVEHNSGFLQILVPLSKQPDYPIRSKREIPFPSPPILQLKGMVLIYLDVWERHITTIEDSAIIEPALGGPDTTTRTKIVAQVKSLFRITGESDEELVSCGSFPGWDRLIKAKDGRLTTMIEAGEETDSPCEMDNKGGYSGLENRLYRVEIHEKSNDLTPATFKWSRDNGSIVYEVERYFTDNKKKIQLKQVGKDYILKLKTGDYIELIDDDSELHGKAGKLLKIVNPVDEHNRIVEVNEDIDHDKYLIEAHAKVRRWDQKRDSGSDSLAIKIVANQETEIENNIKIKFTNEDFKVGDYWTFWARANGEIEMLENEPPHGINHHYCKLALVKYGARGSVSIHDCRKIFPPVTELTSLHYVSGDGQEAMTAEELKKPLQVGVSTGKWPVRGTKVRFERITGGCGLLRGEDAEEVPPCSHETRHVLTNSHGIAECKLKFYSNTVNIQQVKATLLNDDDEPVHLPVIFTANPSLAMNVRYFNQTCGNGLLDGKSTVKAAIDTLCENIGSQTESHCPLNIESIIKGGNGDVLQVDEQMPLNIFLQGFQIICNGLIDENSVNGRQIGRMIIEVPVKKDVMLITLFDGYEDTCTPLLFGFNPFIVPSSFELTNTLPGPPGSTTISWTPSSPECLSKIFDYAETLNDADWPKYGNSIEMLLVRFELNGNLIWGTFDGEPYFLDADLFGRAGTPNSFMPDYPSGNGIKGGMLNMRFYLTPS